MALFHTHKPVEVARRYTGPTFAATTKMSITGGTLVPLMRELHFGFTTIERLCSCGHLEFITTPGDQTTPPTPEQ